LNAAEEAGVNSPLGSTAAAVYRYDMNNVAIFIFFSQSHHSRRALQKDGLGKKDFSITYQWLKDNVRIISLQVFVFPFFLIFSC
jgi:hypothetical protein